MTTMERIADNAARLWFDGYTIQPRVDPKDIGKYLVLKPEDTSDPDAIEIEVYIVDLIAGRCLKYSYNFVEKKFRLISLCPSISNYGCCKHFRAVYEAVVNGYAPGLDPEVLAAVYNPLMGGTAQRTDEFTTAAVPVVAAARQGVSAATRKADWA
jgi:hypothetical protein